MNMNLKYLLFAVILTAFVAVSFASERFVVGSTYDIRQEFAQVTCANESDVLLNLGTNTLPVWERVRVGKKSIVQAGGRFTVVSKEKDGSMVLRYSFGPKHAGIRQLTELPDGSLFKATEGELVDLLSSFAEKSAEEEKSLAAELVRLSKEVERPMTVEEILAYKP